MRDANLISDSERFFTEVCAIGARVGESLSERVHGVLTAAVIVIDVEGAWIVHRV